MSTIRSLKQKYESLAPAISAKGEEAIEPSCLLAFEYEYPEQPCEVCIDTDEFTALCPWTGLPDCGTPYYHLRACQFVPRAKVAEILPGLLS